PSASCRGQMETVLCWLGSAATRREWYDPGARRPALGVDARRRTMLLQEMTWPEISNLSRDIPVVVPVAALEQHGHHMPVFTDSLLVGEVVRRVGAAMSDRVLIAPLMWLGNSHHHMDFQGTLSASPRV